MHEDQSSSKSDLTKTPDVKSNAPITVTSELRSGAGVVCRVVKTQAEALPAEGYGHFGSGVRVPRRGPIEQRGCAIRASRKKSAWPLRNRRPGRNVWSNSLGSSAENSTNRRFVALIDTS